MAMIDGFEIELGGAVIVGAEAGDGFPVIFLHAGVADHRMWQGQMEAVADAGYHAIAYDRRGFGDTTSVDEGFSHLEDLEAVLDALDVHAAIFVGCSMGGGLAIDFALAHPGRCVGLVLVGTSITGASSFVEDSEQGLVMAEEDAEERGDLEILNKVQAHAWLDGPRSANGRVWGAARELFLDMNGKALRHPPLTREEPRPSAIRRLSAITAPTLLISGDLDFSYILQRHDDASDALGNAFGVVLEGTAHLPNLERPDLFNPLLLEFLGAVTA